MFDKKKKEKLKEIDEDIANLRKLHRKAFLVVCKLVDYLIETDGIIPKSQWLNVQKELFIQEEYANKYRPLIKEKKRVRLMIERMA